MPVQKVFILIAALLGGEWIHAFKLTDKGEDGCMLSKENVRCGSSYGETREITVSGCPEVHSDVDILGIPYVVKSCCVEEKYLNISCVASVKWRKCNWGGYAWYYWDGDEESRGYLTLQGPMTIHFSPYSLVGRVNDVSKEKDLEVMWYKSKSYYSSSIAEYGVEIHCDGTTILLKSHRRVTIIIYAVVMLPLVVATIVYYCCYIKRRRASLSRNNQPNQSGIGSEAYGDVKVNQSQAHDSRNNT